MTPRYKLRTLLLLLAVLPPLLWLGWTKYEAWRAGAVWLRRLIRRWAAIVGMCGGHTSEVACGGRFDSEIAMPHSAAAS